MGDVSSINTDILKPGMIFSVEPGIYLPGEFGVKNRGFSFSYRRRA